MHAAGDEAIDVLICDVDLGRFGPSGFELIEKARRRGCAGVACVHSDRIDIDALLLLVASRQVASRAAS